MTRALAEFVVAARYESIPDAVRHEAARSLVNWMGCALGGAHHETLDVALAALLPFAGPPQAGVIGRRERLDAPTAALLNGMSAHVLDFDDTHLRTLLHPSVPVASSLLALAEYRLQNGKALSGAEFLHAFIVGVDVECRIAKAIYPTHIEQWYITGTAGVFGAAAAVGRVLGLDAAGMARAFGIAGTQAAGLREMAGTMCKCFVHGRAAQNGMLSAFMAQTGFTSSDRVIEAPRGFARVLVGDCDLGVILEGLGERWELALNTYKPHACGVVAHPVIDGCLEVRDKHGVNPQQIAAVALRVHPLALKLTGIKAPRGGLESKWSLYHSAAVAFCDGVAGEEQYTDARVFDPLVAAVRERVVAEADAGLRDDEAHVAVTLVDGRRIDIHVEHALGSVDNPMSDRDLEHKFIDLAADTLPAGRAEQLIEQCWKIGNLADAAQLARLAAP
ncbi:MAG: MmgE/PrpD family protein [Burkholderiales bacterium]|nr:MmgE/PrpD family protein [Burkholderiales bacterium]